MHEITVTVRCPVCGSSSSEKKASDIGMKDGQLMHKICGTCIENIPDITTGLVQRLAEDGNAYAVGLCRTLTGKKVQSRGPHCLYKGLRSAEVRNLILTLRKDGAPGREILQSIKDRWPDESSRWVSRSALYRFLERARKSGFKF